MVNVGGRSRGCSTCRRRRVKCDEGRPICQRCKRLNLECSGPKDITFLKANVDHSRRTVKNEVLPPTEAPSQNAVASVPGPLPTWSLDYSALDVYLHHTHKSLCLGDTIDVVLQELQHLDWPAAQQRLSHQAVLAFGIITFGTQRQEPSITDQGYAMYYKAIRGLNEALSDVDTHLCDENVITVTALAFLECMVPSSPGAAEQHIDGLEKLLQLRSGIVISPQMCQLYRLVRAMVIFAALRRHTPFALTGPEWNAIFRAHCSNDEHLEQDLYDVLADCSYLATTMRDTQSVFESDTVRRTMWSIIAHLHDFRQRCGRPPFGQKTSTAWMKALQTIWESGPPFESTFADYFNRPKMDVLMMYYFAFIQTFRVLRSMLDPPGPQFNAMVSRIQAQTKEPVADVLNGAGKWLTRVEHSAGLQILACVPYFLAERSRYRSGHSPHVDWALSCAWETFRGDNSVAGRRMRDAVRTHGKAIAAKKVWEAE